MSKIIDLYGGPGTGKSTSAAYLFYLLKASGLNAELAREYVKEWAWEGRKIGTYDQFYFFGKQLRKESMLLEKVEVIVTDSPVALGLVYTKKYSSSIMYRGIEEVTKAYYEQCKNDGHKHYHVLLKRSKPYNPSGRFQTEEEAKELDLEMRRALESLGIEPMECDTDEQSLRNLLEDLEISK